MEVTDNSYEIEYSEDIGVDTELITVAKSSESMPSYTYIFLHGLNESGEFYLRKIVETL